MNKAEAALFREAIGVLGRLAAALEQHVKNHAPDQTQKAPPISRGAAVLGGASLPEASPPDWATPLRINVLTRRYPTNATEQSIRNEMLLHPGPPLPAWREIGSYAVRVLKLHRRAATFSVGKSTS